MDCFFYSSLSTCLFIRQVGQLTRRFITEHCDICFVCLQIRWVFQATFCLTVLFVLKSQGLCLWTCLYFYLVFFSVSFFYLFFDLCMQCLIILCFFLSKQGSVTFQGLTVESGGQWQACGWADWLFFLHKLRRRFRFLAEILLRTLESDLKQSQIGG